jgi:hypothetical protein
MKNTLTTFLALTALLAARVAAAQDDDAGPPPACHDCPEASEYRMKAAFLEGRRAMREGDPAKACAAFGRGLHEYEGRQAPPGLLLNLAECSAALNKPLAALRYEDRALAALPPSDERHAAAETKQRELEAQAPVLRVKLAPGAEGAAVSVDGKFVRASDLDHELVEAGQHRVTVLAHDGRRSSYLVTAAAGQTQTLVVDLPPSTPSSVKVPIRAAPPPEPAPAPPATEPAHDEHGGGVPAWVSWGAVGTGGALLITSAITTAMMAGKGTTMDQHCDAKLACDQTGVDAAKAGKTLSTIATVTLVAGAVVGGAGVFLVVSGGGRPAASDSGSAASGATLLVRGAF